MSREILEVVDEYGRVIGLAPRAECHGNPALRHRVVHVHLFDSGGRLLLQRRSLSKDIEPGKWDASVGGHVDPGETPCRAAHRELLEELGVRGVWPDFSHRYTFTSPRETELVYAWWLLWDGPVAPDAGEISEVRWWTAAEIAAALPAGTFTPSFIWEWQHFLGGSR
jgi:isopentenyl-diphosphate delta-isomerase type 1